MKWLIRLCCYCLLLAMCVCVSGCVTSKAFTAYEAQKGVQVSEAKQGVIVFLEYWDFRSGMIRESLALYPTQIPDETIATIGQLDILSAKFKKQGSLTDFEYGRVLGLILKLRISVSGKIFQKYLPMAL